MSGEPNSAEPQGPLVTVLLPAFNEEQAITQVIVEIREVMERWRTETGTAWEILVVDDHSSDQTAERAEATGVRVIRRKHNGGSGAARKTGIRAAQGEFIAMLDADGSYDPQALPELLKDLPEFDQVNGARTTEEGTLKLLRIPAKWVIRQLAQWICRRKIPDLNTGMKVFKRDLMLRYLWVMPDGFSCVSSMTMAFLCNDHAVKYMPVEYRPRVGKSKFHPVRDTAKYILTVIRLSLYFRPLRAFLPVSLLMFVFAIALGTRNIIVSETGLHDADIMLVISAMLIFVLGLLADLIVAHRR
ncbi:MAG: glycosyltransferase family 2 protein [Pirellulales bacterium]|nr:glycosyltransferase family 2 protein [Pirellulales bacterium]